MGCCGGGGNGKRQGVLLLPMCVRVLQWFNDSPRDQDLVLRLFYDAPPPADREGGGGWYDSNWWSAGAIKAAAQN